MKQNLKPRVVRSYSAARIQVCLYLQVLPRTYLEASLFFSFLDLGLAVMGSSLTGVRSLITLFSFLSSLPIWRSFLGLGVRSSTSVLRDFFAAYFPVWNMQKGELGIDTVCTETCQKNLTCFFFWCTFKSSSSHYKIWSGITSGPYGVSY